MRKGLILPVMLVGALALTACSKSAKDESAAAGNTVVGDANSTMSNAVDDLDAASNQAFGAAQNMMDNTADAMDNATDTDSDPE
ncbi:hypothetical protein GCM10023219_11800 [Stakelama sediminis]|uniref:Entericidin n=1 Tax=Stakelama sediminis TaxID=463200 RepID=A0A840YWI4_9SPHN|nr:hypothetical protein [Stakelama sediminis]MBB5717904.1 hypothetical protein [Stakelama sediminis]